MDRKQFLYRSTLLSLAATGLPAIARAFQDAPSANEYLSSKFKVGTNEYAWFISIPGLNNADEEEFFMIVIYNYSAHATGASPQTKYKFKRTGKVKWEGQTSVMNLKLEEKVSGDAPLPPGFPKKPTLKASDKKQLLLETGKDVYTTLTYQAPGKDSDRAGCFLTTACTLSKGLQDDCEELCCLRQYRDGYLSRTMEGAGLVDEYYAIGPKIVAAIDSCSNRTAIYEELYSSLVMPSVSLIRERRFEDAREYYRAYVGNLEEVFLGMQ